MEPNTSDFHLQAEGDGVPSELENKVSGSSNSELSDSGDSSDSDNLRTISGTGHEREFSPEINPYRNYSTDERLKLAEASYWQKLSKFKNNEGPKPKAAPIARNYNISDRTLRRHISTPGAMTRSEQHASMQVLSVAEEAALIDRLGFLNEWNIPADKDQVICLAEAILHTRNPQRTLGKDWFYAFCQRHKDKIRFVYAENKSKERCNADNWDLMDDFFWKVCNSTSLSYEFPN